MPYNPGSFTSAASLPTQESLFDALSKAMSQGYNAAQAPQNQRLENLKATSGIAREEASADLIENMYGKEHPLSKAIRERQQQEIENRKSLIENRDMQTKTARFRASSPLAKLISERDELIDNVGMDPEEKSRRIADYNRQIQKNTSQSALTKQAVMAENLDKTFDQIEPKLDALTKYSGLKGAAKKKLDAFKSGLGLDTPEYKEYQKAITDAALAAKQIRQTYQDSIQPAALEKIDQLINPESLMLSPDLAADKIREAMNIIRRETQTFKDATGVQNILPKTQETKILAPNGQVYMVPGDKLDAALKAGGVRV